MARRRFEFVDAQSNKYWEIWRDGAEVLTQYGRIGSTGKVSVKDALNESAAASLVEKLVASKTAKGYIEVDAPSGTPSRPRSATKPIELSGPMNEALFWELIARFNWKRTGDDDAVLRPAVNALSNMTVEDIFAFEDLLAEKLYALDTREVARCIYRGSINPDDGDDYISADDFLYARCVVVANGKEMFDAVLADPNEAPQGLEFEALLYLASTAYEKKTGASHDHVTPLSWESFSNLGGSNLRDHGRKVHGARHSSGQSPSDVAFACRRE